MTRLAFRRRAALLLVGGLATLTAPNAAAEPLTRVRVQAPEAASLAELLSRGGYDVVEGSVGASSLEVIGSKTDLVALERAGLPFELLEIGRPLAVPRTLAAAIPPSYQDYESIVATLASLADAHPTIARLVDVTAAYGAPATFENRHIFGLAISDQVGEDEDEPSVLFVGTHHAREIGVPVALLHTATRLLEGYGTDAALSALIDANEIWLVPVWNPDGYDYVFSTDNLWRKNLAPTSGGVGVDLNRNYDFGWSSSCAGSTDGGSETYKGTRPGSEAETQTMERFMEAERFAKVLDVHSLGREVLYSYRCLANPLVGFLQLEAQGISEAAGYAGATRPPSAEGEHEEFQFARTGAYAFLMEIGDDFQPPYDASQAEAEQIFPAFTHVLERPISLQGHVRDACTGEPLESEIDIAGVDFVNGERNGGGGPFGRYHAFLPAGSYEVLFSATGRRTRSVTVQVSDEASEVLDVELVPPGMDSCPAGGTGGTGEGGATQETGGQAGRGAGAPDSAGETGAGSDATAGGAGETVGSDSGGRGSSTSGAPASGGRGAGDGGSGTSAGGTRPDATGGNGGNSGGGNADGGQQAGADSNGGTSATNGGRIEAGGGADLGAGAPAAAASRSDEASGCGCRLAPNRTGSAELATSLLLAMTLVARTSRKRRAGWTARV